MPVLDGDSVTMEVRTRLRELAVPLKEQLVEIEKRLVILGRESRDLREAKKELEKTIRGLEPTPAKANGATNASKIDHIKKVKAVEVYLRKNADDLKDGFTAAELQRRMKAQGVEPLPSPEKARGIVDALHEQGVLRAVKIVKGGGMLFVIAGRNGGDDGKTNET